MRLPSFETTAFSIGAGIFGASAYMYGYEAGVRGPTHSKFSASALKVFAGIAIAALLVLTSGSRMR
jgi:hypothetical protein